MGENKKITIECECGTHMLEVESDIETSSYISENQNEAIRFQSIYLAMFHYGNCKPSLLERIKRAFKVLRTGELYADQITLTPSEGAKLRDFLNDNLLVPKSLI